MRKSEPVKNYHREFNAANLALVKTDATNREALDRSTGKWVEKFEVFAENDLFEALLHGSNALIDLPVSKRSETMVNSWCGHLQDMSGYAPDKTKTLVDFLRTRTGGWVLYVRAIDALGEVPAAPEISGARAIQLKLAKALGCPPI